MPEIRATGGSDVLYSRVAAVGAKLDSVFTGRQRRYSRITTSKRVARLQRDRLRFDVC